MYFTLTTAQHNQAQDYGQGSGYDVTLVHRIAVAALPRALLLKLFTLAICLLELLQRFIGAGSGDRIWSYVLFHVGPSALHGRRRLVDFFVRIRLETVQNVYGPADSDTNYCT